ncbi:MAG TPA: hypothetical protein VGS79_07535 [Puia sp.]|nr:hypothetical protein [Puia sp.]
MGNNESLKEVLTDLRKKGYEADLNFETETFGLYAGDLDMRLNPDEFHVDEIDRPGHECSADAGVIVYAISTATGVKGVEVDKQH